ncbi:hypothetical protein GpartN1_g2609.t1 [Galdieria partita]|uniref:Methyltransferase type 11 domain-containing protein n=1 Tax=Galdieria partita TaxID=83374 RepID=A0A9C7PU26_9RHOD|nr:hypothetical protein GpartN1_g2609.t1 [Galdieria partita]
MRLVAFVQGSSVCLGCHVNQTSKKYLSLSMTISRRNFLKQSILSLSVLNCFVERSLQAEVCYDNYAKSYDNLETSVWNRLFQLDRLRKELLTYISGGIVLEVGVGTGLNLESYPWQVMKQFIGVDTSSSMLEQARNKLNSLSINNDVDWELIEASVTRLPFPDNYFDHVVDSFGLCVFDNPYLALKEMSRVCKKDGTILLLEHSSSPYWMVREYQRWTGNLVAKMAKGCHWSVPLQDLLKHLHLYTIYQKYKLLGTVSLHVVSK